MNHPDLLALLRSDLTNEAAAEAGAHLNACADCRLELAELAIVHAVLSRSARTLGPRPTGSEEAAPLPPRRRDRRRRRIAGLVAALAVVLGLVGAVVALTHDDGASPSLDVRLTTPLDPLDPDGGGPGEGRVELVAAAERTTELSVTTRGLPRLGPDQFYEVWLLDPETIKLLPLGPLGPEGRATFDIDDSLLERYSAVDVSLEDDDGDPGHSVTSVLRASYDPDPPTRS